MHRVVVALAAVLSAGLIVPAALGDKLYENRYQRRRS